MDFFFALRHCFVVVCLLIGGEVGCISLLSCVWAEKDRESRGRRRGWLKEDFLRSPEERCCSFENIEGRALDLEGLGRVGQRTSP